MLRWSVNDVLGPAICPGKYCARCVRRWDPGMGREEKFGYLFFCKEGESENRTVYLLPWLVGWCLKCCWFCYGCIGFWPNGVVLRHAISVALSAVRCSQSSHYPCSAHWPGGEMTDLKKFSTALLTSWSENWVSVCEEWNNVTMKKKCVEDREHRLHLKDWKAVS